MSGYLSTASQAIQRFIKKLQSLFLLYYWGYYLQQFDNLSYLMLTFILSVIYFQVSKNGLIFPIFKLNSWHKMYLFKVYISVIFNILNKVMQPLSHFIHFHYPQKETYPLAVSSIVVTINLLCLHSLPTLDISYKWNHTICSLLCLNFSLSIMFSRFIFVVACISTFFMAT